MRWGVGCSIGVSAGKAAESWLHTRLPALRPLSPCTTLCALVPSCGDCPQAQFWKRQKGTCIFVDLRISRINRTFTFFLSFLLAFSCFTTQFLSYSKVNQLYMYVWPLFFRFFSRIGRYRALNRAPCAVFSLVLYFVYKISNVCISVAVSPAVPPPPWCPHVCSYICVSISVLQMRSSIPCF